MNGRAAARAIDALRRGWAVTVRATDGAIRVMAVEGADALTLKTFDPARDSSTRYKAAREPEKIGGRYRSNCSTPATGPAVRIQSPYG